MEKKRGRKKLSELEKARRACKRAWIKYSEARLALRNQTPEHKAMEEERNKRRGRRPLTLVRIAEHAKDERREAVSRMREVEKAEGVEPIPIRQVLDVLDPAVDGEKRVGQPLNDELAAIDYKIRRLEARRVRILEGVEDGKENSERQRGAKGGLRGRKALSREEKIAAVDRDIRNLLDEIHKFESKMSQEELAARKLKILRNKARVLRAECKREGLLKQLEDARNYEAEVISGAVKVAPLVKKTIVLEHKIAGDKTLIDTLIEQGKLHRASENGTTAEARRVIQQANVQSLTEQQRIKDLEDALDKARGRGLRRSVDEQQKQAND